jgi:predicted NAD/FAD-binding protein
MTILHGPEDGIEGERILCICRKIASKRVVPGTHLHRALELVISGTPTKCFILKPLRYSKK